MKRTKVIIVGGGFGGLETAFSLKTLLKEPFDITLINRTRHHTFIPSIHLIVSGRVKPEEISIPLKIVLGTAGIRFVQDEVLSVDVETREVVTTAATFPFDYLVLATGAAGNFFDIPGAEEYSFRFRTPYDAVRIRMKLLALLDGPARPVRIMAAGAGTEGVELISEIRDVVREEGHEDELQAGSITVEMIERKNHLLPAFGGEVRNYAGQYLRNQDITLSSGERIAEVGQDFVVLNSGKKSAVSLLIWSGGIKPPELIQDLRCQKDPWGWLKVTDCLHLPGDTRVYGIGDAVSIYTDDGPLSLPRLAYHAQDQARVAALNISRAMRGNNLVRYTPGNKPQLISLGNKMGIFVTEERMYAGRWIVFLKKTVERRHLLSYLSRPLSSAIVSKVPGAELLHRFRMRLPL